MTTTDEQDEAAEVNPAAMPRIPRFGAGATGAVSLLLVGGVLLVPFLGMMVAPLGLVPMLHFQAGGTPGIRAWGWVVALLAAISTLGFGSFPVALLAAYILIVVLPAMSVELWARLGWSESRWVVAIVGVAATIVLAGAFMWALPVGPVEATATYMGKVAADVKEMYGAAGFAEVDIELAFDSAVHVVPWVLPSFVITYLVAIVFWIRPRIPLLGFAVKVVRFEDYRGDEWLAAAFALFGLGTIFFGGTARWFALNLLIAVLMLYFVQGLAMIRAHLARWLGRGWFVRWGVAFMCFYPPMPILVTALGVADSFFPLRPAASDDGGNP